MQPPLKITHSRENGYGIPYGSDYRNGRTCAGFIDLVREPHRISEIKEVQDFSAMRDFLIYVNNKSGQFFTAGCEKTFGDTPPNSPKPRYCRGYLEFCFRDLNFNREAIIFEKLVERFNDGITRPWPFSKAEFVIQGVVYGEMFGFSCIYWFTGFGDTDESCKLSAQYAIEDLGIFLSSMRKDDQLFRG